METLTVQDEGPLAPVVSEVASAASKFARARRHCDGNRRAVLLKVRNIGIAVQARQEKCDRKNGQGYSDEGGDDLSDLSGIDPYGRPAQHSH